MFIRAYSKGSGKPISLRPLFAHKFVSSNTFNSRQVVSAKSAPLLQPLLVILDVPWDKSLDYQ